MSHGAQLDLLSIDVEGMDDVVLRSHDWDTFRPTVVIVEHEGQTLDVLNSSAVYQFLTEKKYTLCAATDLSFIFKDTQ